MGKNWGRKTITNADKRQQTQTTFKAPDKDGVVDERLDRRPMGKVERFVDKDGGVMSIQMYGDGDPKRLETEIRTRSQQHRKGAVEHAKCPLKHGTRYSSPIATKDFKHVLEAMPSNLQAECKSDPKVMSRRDGELYAGTGCPHIEALIAYRAANAKDAADKRNAQRAAQEKREAEKAALAEKQTLAIEALLAERAERKPKGQTRTPE